MCTISLVPHINAPNGFILTSNRDEAISRKTFQPELEIHNSSRLYFPKDEVAGGTWIGVSELKRCVCLMNGAREPHVRQPQYRKSRGIIVKDFLAHKNLDYLFNDYSLFGIEPFTVVLVDWSQALIFYELIWDGVEFEVNELGFKEHIWSSSPLYTPETRSLRSAWFERLKNTKGLSEESILDFHHNAGEGDKNKDLIIDRGFLRTKSITQVVNSTKGLKFWYKDLMDNKTTVEYIQFKA